MKFENKGKWIKQIFESSQKNEATLKDGTKVKVIKGWYSGKTGTIAGTAEEYDPDTHRTTNYCYMVKIPGQGIIQIDRDNVVAESSQKNETSLRDLNLDLSEDTNAVIASANKIRQRFEYRTLQNQSYDEKQAEKIYLEIRKELEKAKKLIDACYNKIG